MSLPIPVDTAVVDGLYRRHAYALIEQLRRQYPLVGDAADDAVQHAFSRLAQTDVPVRDPMSWVARSANNFMIDVLRRGKRHELAGSASDMEPWLPPSEGPDADDVEERELRAAALWRALRQIDEPQHTALIMMYMQGCNYRQIAEATGLAMASVGTILLRARKRLRTLVEAELRGHAVAMRAL